MRRPGALLIGSLVYLAVIFGVMLVLSVFTIVWAVYHDAMQPNPALTAHPAVREAAVVARTDKNGNTKPAAYVVVRTHVHLHSGEAFSRELQQFVADRIGGYKSPRGREVVPELPKTATGKLQRYKLREHSARPGESSRSR